MGKKIMIVEDDTTFHKLYTEILDDTDYEIIQAYDGDDALGKLEDGIPDLVILDIMLDMVTGDTFFIYMKSMSEYKQIPVIVVSSCDEGDYSEMRKLDPNLVFLDKASIGEKLVETIKAVIG